MQGRAIGRDDFPHAAVPPGTLVDVGAHDGLITLPLARLPGSRVLAFEPLPPAMARAARGPRDAHPNVECIAAALGDQAGEITLAMPVLDGVAQEQWASTAKTTPRMSRRA